MDAITPQWAWQFLPFGYVLTLAIELPVLWFGLSRRHPPRRRLAAGLWLTACTYPIVVLVLPLWLHDASRTTYLVIAETFAPLAECALFYAAFAARLPSDQRALARDFAAIVVANLASFGLGEVVGRWLT
jgi:hypothetical protein